MGDRDRLHVGDGTHLQVGDGSHGHLWRIIVDGRTRRISLHVG